jgi:hypothetical protein
MYQCCQLSDDQVIGISLQGVTGLLRYVLMIHIKAILNYFQLKADKVRKLRKKFYIAFSFISSCLGKRGMTRTLQFQKHNSREEMTGCGAYGS